MRPRPRPKRYKRRLAIRNQTKFGDPGLELRPHQIVLRPLVTEKGTHLGSKLNAYTFMVSPLASKDQIAVAVQQLFNVRVEAVRTQNRRPKNVRFRQDAGKTSSWKKAIVTLNSEDKIDFI